MNLLHLERVTASIVMVVMKYAPWTVQSVQLYSLLHRAFLFSIIIPIECFRMCDFKVNRKWKKNTS